MQQTIRSTSHAWVFCGLIILGLTACQSEKNDNSTGWQDTFPVEKNKLSNTGAGRYFILEPGHRLRYQHDGEVLTITVLNETKVVDGVETRVIEEREEKDGKLVEISRNYFAIDRATGDVYYFGEDVDIYKDGKVTNHGGSWLSGISGARFGLMMPGSPRKGERYQIEVAPGVAMDRAEVTDTNATVSTRAGNFQGCVEIHETSALEKGSGHKRYAPGVGLVQDDEFVLVEVGNAKP